MFYVVLNRINVLNLYSECFFLSEYRNIINCITWDLTLPLVFYFIDFFFWSVLFFSLCLYLVWYFLSSYVMWQLTWLILVRPFFESVFQVVSNLSTVLNINFDVMFWLSSNFLISIVDFLIWPMRFCYFSKMWILLNFYCFLSYVIPFCSGNFVFVWFKFL